MDQHAAIQAARNKFEAGARRARVTMQRPLPTSIDTYTLTGMLHVHLSGWCRPHEPRPLLRGHHGLAAAGAHPGGAPTTWHTACHLGPTHRDRGQHND